MGEGGRKKKATKGTLFAYLIQSGSGLTASHSFLTSYNWKAIFAKRFEGKGKRVKSR